VLDFNRVNISASSISVGINAAIEQAARRNVRQPRGYLGASIVGHECARRVQYDWFCDPVHAARTYEIFDRGHYFEQRSRQCLVDAGFRLAPAQALAFSAAGGLLRGHADGIIIHGPDLPGLYLIYPLIWEHKALGSKGWKKLERDGLIRAFPEYATQVALYQSYLDVTNPALFTALNANTCERIHFLVPFDAERAQAASDRAVAIIEASRAGQLLPRFTDDASDWRCVMCSHRERCWKEP
jgi:hypothetical protein